LAQRWARTSKTSRPLATSSLMSTSDWWSGRRGSSAPGSSPQVIVSPANLTPPETVKTTRNNAEDEPRSTLGPGAEQRSRAPSAPLIRKFAPEQRDDIDPTCRTTIKDSSPLRIALSDAQLRLVAEDVPQQTSRGMPDCSTRAPVPTGASSQTTSPMA